MRSTLCLAVLAALYCAVSATFSRPKVQVYSSKPGEFEADNTLICRVSNFHPPDISIKLLKNGEEISGAVESDLAFNQNWQFHLTKNVGFKPQASDEYICQVTHMKETKDYAWVPNM